MFIERELTLNKRQNPFQSLIDELFPGDDDESSTSRRSSTSSTTRTRSRDDESSTSRRTTSTTSTPSNTPTPPPATSPTTREKTTLVLTSSADDPNASNGASNNSTSTKGGLSPLVIGIIVAASVIFGLIFLALLARKFFQMRRRRKRNTWGAGSIAPFAPPIDDEKPAYPPARGDAGYGQDTYAASLGAYRTPAPVAKTDPVTYNSNSYGSNYPQYTAPSAYNPPQIYSPAAPSSAGYTAPYYAGDSGVYGGISNAAAFNKSTYNPADLIGATPIAALPSAPKVQLSIVRRTYQPTLPDELSISTGESVQVIEVFDDGWCKVQKLGTNEVGVVPYECLEAGQTGGLAPGEDNRSKRASSLFSGKN